MRLQLTIHKTNNVFGLKSNKENETGRK